MLLGDRVEMIIMALLPTKLYARIHGQTCGCTKRKNYLNKLHRRVRKWIYDKRNSGKNFYG